MANNIPSGVEISPSMLTNGWMGEANPTTATTSTGTEVMHASVTATLATGRRYRVSYHGQFQAAAAAELAEFRFRIASGASVTITSTQMRITAQHADVGGRNNAVAFFHVFTVAAAGQYTVGVSIRKNTGLGASAKLDAGAGLVEPMLLLEDIGGV